MPKGTYQVKALRRKSGAKVAGHIRSLPTLPKVERARRARVAKTELLPKAIKATGQKGFGATAKALAGKPGIKSPERLAGWLKGQAKEAGELSPKHPYVGRKGFRKYPAAAGRMSPKEYKAYLRLKRR